MEETMTRKELIAWYQKQIALHKTQLANNAEKLQIYEGDLLPKVKKVLEKTLSKNYYSQIEERIIPINILPRIIDKMAKVYMDSPIRQAKDKNESDSKLMNSLAEDMDLNSAMALADEYANLFKCYALEPFIDEGKPCVRVLPADRFIALSRDKKNPLKMTDYLKCMGKESINGKECELWYGYTKEEFIPFILETGDEHQSSLDGNDGKNVYGVIPAVYGNRSRLSITPTEDTDITQMTKMIPVLLSDLGGAIMFQCFTIIYGIDVKAENLTMSPNAFWSLKSDVKTDQKPSLGTLSPSVDSDKALNFIKQVLAFWLETKGVRIGAMNSIDAQNAASGIAKIIDEMDVYNILKRSIVFFRKEEAAFWELMRIMNNYWMKSVEDYNTEDYGLFTEKFKGSTIFDEPRPEISRNEQIDGAVKEIDAGLLDRGTAIKELNPDLGEEELKDRYARVGLNEKGEEIEEETDDEEEGVIQDVDEKEVLDKTTPKSGQPTENKDSIPKKTPSNKPKKAGK